MEIYPLEWPRLSGVLSYGLPHYWEVVDTEESIEIIPAKMPYGLMAYFVLLGLAVAVGTPLILSRMADFPDKGWAIFGGVGVGLGLVLVSLILRATFGYAQTRGPILAISFADKEVCLPREGKSLPFENIVRWEIVYGAWVRKTGGKPFLFADEISELQMIVKNDEEGMSAYAIVGASWRYDKQFGEAANTIARRMNLPLVVVNGDENGQGDWRDGLRISKLFEKSLPPT